MFLKRELAGVGGFERRGLDALFVEPTGKDAGVAVRDKNLLRARFADGRDQARPIGVVG